MKQELKEKLLLLADKYEVEEFIMDDPLPVIERPLSKVVTGLITSFS